MGGGARPLRIHAAPAFDSARHHDGTARVEVDQAYRDRTQSNLERFRDFPCTSELFLAEDLEAPAVGERVRNRDLAHTYRRIAREGGRALYRGEIAEDIVEAVTDPPVAPDSTRNVRPGVMATGDLADYRSGFGAPRRSHIAASTSMGWDPRPAAG